MDKIWEEIKKYEKPVILGFGREGKSTLSLIRKFDTDKIIYIADKDQSLENLTEIKNDPNLKLFLGEDYLGVLPLCDLVIKTPGIRLPDEILVNLKGKITSQIDLLLKNYRDQTIGITGTKGKSTTASFLHHYLEVSGVDSVLLGNIGVPAFSMLENIKRDTWVVAELSSYMLRDVSASPHFAIFLNIFPEHLNYHGSFEDYALSKANIFKFQKSGDYLLLGDENEVEKIYSKIGSQALLIKEANTPNENTRGFPDKIMKNFQLAKKIAILAGAKEELFEKALETFETLPHRQEMIGTFKGVSFVDDAISTIPESTILALETFPNTDILLLGGLDRGISAEKLIEKILSKKNLKVFCQDETGKIIFEKLSKEGAEKRAFFFEDLESAVKSAYEMLPSGGVVLLSPAAASYNQYKNFEEKGDAFKSFVKKYGK